MVSSLASASGVPSPPSSVGSSGTFVADRSPGERLTQITPGVRALRLVTSDWRMSEVLSDELIWFDSSRTPTRVHVVSLESVGYPVRPIKAGRIFALPVDVAPLGASLFEVPLAVDLGPDLTRGVRECHSAWFRDSYLLFP